MAVCGALVWTPRLLRSWLDALGTPRAMLDAVRSDDVVAPPGTESLGVQALERLRAVDDDAARAAIDDLAQSGARMVADGDVDYPASLRDLVDPPPVIYVRGELAGLKERSVAVVGSRGARRH